VSHVFRHGHVWLVESENRPARPKIWYDPMIEQLCTFVGEGSTEHDDFVDSTTQAVRYFLDQGLVRVTPQTRQEIEDETLRYAIELDKQLDGSRQNPYAA
jgi:hypothetical protein